LDVNHVGAGVLSDIELVLVHVALVGHFATMEQIVELVQIQLNHIALNLDLEMVLPFHPLFDREEFHETAWHNTRIVSISVDRMCLSTSCLAIGKDADVVSVDSALYKHFRVFKDVLLCRLTSKAGVKVELLLIHLDILLDPNLERKLIMNVD
jgi:hypothetical protein